MAQSKLRQLVSPLVKHLFLGEEAGAASHAAVPHGVADHWHQMIPPLEIRTRIGPFADAGVYRDVAEGTFTLLRNSCELQINEDVLDIGCGCGQMAVPLFKYLNSRATYEGFDIDSVSIDWAVQHIAAQHPNFHFHLADIFSTSYNTKGTKKATEYKFPYKNASFDVVFAKSVLTHLLPSEIENYIGETARVLRSGGRCWLTFFLLNKESLALLESGKSTLDLKFVREGHRLLDEKIPESAVAIDETLVDKYFEKFKLKIKRPNMYGEWCGRTSATGYQDVIVATKL